MKICLIQICSQNDPEKNMEKIQSFIDQAKKAEPNVSAFFLPEVFYSMSDGIKPTEFVVKDDNDAYKSIQNLAIKNRCYLLGGTVAYSQNGKVFNKSLNFAPNGELIEDYNKIHLFTLNLKSSKENTQLDERNLYDSGSELKMMDLEEFKLGLTICFDLRFPEMFRKLYSQGANVFSVSSAFTKPTGKAHWKTLLQARAIENQSYVIACNQWGRHNEKMESYGHSMVVDPWGEIVSIIEAGEGYIFADLEIEKVKQVRARMDMTSRF